MREPRGPGKPRRLRGYDFASCGEYFVTVVTRDRGEVLGRVEGATVRLFPAGEAVRDAWTDLPRRFPFLRLDEFVVMPNHIHGILVLVPSDERALDQPAVRPGRVHLDIVLQVFKSISTIEVNRVLGRTGVHLWQRGYYEHIVGDDRALERIRGDISGNPEAWPGDPYNPEAGLPRRQA